MKAKRDFYLFFQGREKKKSDNPIARIGKVESVTHDFVIHRLSSPRWLPSRSIVFLYSETRERSMGMQILTCPSVTNF